VRDIWARLEKIAAGAHKSLALRPPATEQAIAAAERTIGLPFPDDFRASLLVHDGQEPSDGEDDDDDFAWLPGHERLASLEAIVDEWKVEQATYTKFHATQVPEEIADGFLQSFFWHPKRIPVAGNPYWDQDNTYLDFFNGSRGVPGQLVKFGKGCFGELHGPSFGQALEMYVSALESGEWVFRDGRCVPRNKRIKSWPQYMAKKLGL
jgi:cell wall assembly regulator SMI1